MAYQSPGFNHSPEYVASGLPWLTSSNLSDGSGPLKINFPLVTRTITVGATTGAVTFSFTAKGLTGTNNFVVSSGTTHTFEFRVREMWVTGSTFSIAAGLTGIPTGSAPYLTGSYPWNPADPHCTGSNSGGPWVLTYDGVG